MSSEDDLFIENMSSYNNFDLLIEKINQLVFEDYNIKEKNNIKILNDKIKSDSVSDDNKFKFYGSKEPRKRLNDSTNSKPKKRPEKNYPKKKYISKR